MAHTLVARRSNIIRIRRRCPTPLLQIPLIPLVFAQKTVTGTIVGSRQDMQVADDDLWLAIRPSCCFS